ncbi:hypothetical protein AWB67_05232 [Caballeronia terrestris]|uniref:Uncharacterized protein n=1 Tax=Caballeronia terrestris TaxID=1226301 RepID=A0A158KBZ4_9BURK|nr:hypothetical protein [Caballeronia terrestris]SAL78253.1 hypothetical protein AWB67_05232 [Caballeronia terrestris]
MKLKKGKCCVIDRSDVDVHSGYADTVWIASAKFMEAHAIFFSLLAEAAMNNFTTLVNPVVVVGSNVNHDLSLTESEERSMSKNLMGPATKKAIASRTPLARHSLLVFERHIRGHDHTLYLRFSICWDRSTNIPVIIR